MELERPTLLQREQDFAFLRRWLAGAAPMAVLYGSRGMGKAALGWAFAEKVPESLWVDLPEGNGLSGLAAAAAQATGVRPPSSIDPESVAGALAFPFTHGTKLLVIDGYGDVEEAIVDAMEAFLRKVKTVGGKALVLAQETTPAYCRFYSKKEMDSGVVVERHLHGLDLEGCRAMIGRPAVDEEALRRIYMIRKSRSSIMLATRGADSALL